MKKGIRILLILIFVFILVNTGIYADESGIAITKVPYSQEYEEWLKLPQELREKRVAPQMYDVDESVINSLNNSNNISKGRRMVRKSSLPDKYNTLDEMNIKVKNQNTRNICWAFAFTSAAEIACKKYENENYEFSPMHIDYACTKKFKDIINPYAQIRGYNEGGNLNNLISYLSSGQGPILEEYMPFDTNKGEISYSEMPNNLQSKFIDLQQLPGISTRKKEEICRGDRDYSDEELALRENIKAKIIQSGGIWCDIMMDKYTQNKNPVLYTYEMGGVKSHAAVLIGYDDNYSANNFSEDKALRPKHDGAYIALNSYGEGWGDNGIFYISYDDVNVEDNLGYIKKSSDVDYDTIYQHNYGDSQMFYDFKPLNSTQKQLYTANIFERDVTKREQLTKLFIPNTSYFSLQDVDIEIYINPQSSSLDPSKLVKVECDVTNLNQAENYINLKEPIELSGEKYAVVVKYILKDENTSIKICLQNSIQDLEQIEEGQSFYSFNCENWNDLYNFNFYNLPSNITRGAGSGGVNPSSHYAIKLKAITKSIDKSIKIINIKNKNTDRVYSNLESEISAYVVTTANLNGANLTLKLLKDGLDVTDKIDIVSLPKVKSRASNIKFKNKGNLENGVYKLQISTPDNIISEKEYEVTSIENDENFVKLEYEDEKFIDALKESIPNFDNYTVRTENKMIYIKKEFKEFVEQLTYLSILSNDDNVISSIKGIEIFKNLNYLFLSHIDVKDLDAVLNLTNLKYLYISNSNIEKKEFNFENTNLKRLSMYNCELSDISKLKVPDTIISIDLEKNHIKVIPNTLYEKAKYISVLNQTVYDEITLDQNDSYALVEMPEILRLKSPTELIFRNCEYDEDSGKIKISTKNIEEGIAEIELPFPEGAYDIDVIDPYGSKYIINYKVVEHKIEPVDTNTDNDNSNDNFEQGSSFIENLNPRTGTKVIYLYTSIVLSITIILITLKSKKINITNK